MSGLNMLSRRLALSGVRHRIVTAHNAPTRPQARSHYPEVVDRASAVVVMEMLDLKPGKARIGKDGIVEMYRGDVDLAQLDLVRLPLRFREVTGEFSCGFNRLISLVGCPQKAGSVFANSNNLKSLVGGPETVLKTYDVSDNELETLDVLPVRIGEKFIASRNPGCPFQHPPTLRKSVNFYGG